MYSMGFWAENGAPGIQAGKYSAVSNLEQVNNIVCFVGTLEDPGGNSRLSSFLRKDYMQYVPAPKQDSLCVCVQN